MKADEAMKSQQSSERREMFYMSAVPPHPSRIPRHLQSEDKNTPATPVHERFHCDRCPTKPTRNKSPMKSREDDKEREMIRVLLAKERQQYSPKSSRQFVSEVPTADIRRVAPEHTATTPDESQTPCHAQAVMIQIAPGVQVPLRDKEEVRAAVQEDFYLPGLCLGCSATLFVVQDAAFVLCPDCRTVSPMEGDFVDRAAAGVGSGFTFEELTQWQTDILNQHRNS